MKIILIALLSFAISAALAHAQGNLTPPPGVPLPNMRSLLDLWNKVHEVEGQNTGIQAEATAIETRAQAIETTVLHVPTDISVGIANAPVTINTRGVYYLKTDLDVATGHAITITADDVTLDLRGFSIRSTASPANGTGILINGIRKNVRIFNGNIQGATTYSSGSFSPGGFLHGISGISIESRNVFISDVLVHGVAGTGIQLGFNDEYFGTVERCIVSVCEGAGILADRVAGCAAVECGSTSINARLVSDSIGSSTGANAGISAVSNASNSIGNSSSGIGIAARTIFNCLGTSATDRGIVAFGSVFNSVGTGEVAGIAPMSSSLGPNVTNSVGTSVNGMGIRVSGTVFNSTGKSEIGTGISAEMITNSYAETESGTRAMDADGAATHSRARRDGGVAIRAAIAIGCTVHGNGTVDSAKKFFGTP